MVFEWDENKEKIMLVCVVRKREIHKIVEIVEETDKHAFMWIGDFIQKLSKKYSFEYIENYGGVSPHTTIDDFGEVKKISIIIAINNRVLIRKMLKTDNCRNRMNVCKLRDVNTY